MAGQPTKPGNYGGDMIIITKKRGSCGACAHFCEDGSCAIHPIVLKEVGTDYWRTCHDYTPRSTNAPVPHPFAKPCNQEKIKSATDVSPCADSQMINGRRICKRRCAPHYGRTCYVCTYHREVSSTPHKQSKGKWVDWQEIDWQSTNQARLKAGRSKKKKHLTVSIPKKNKPSVSQNNGYPDRNITATPLADLSKTKASLASPTSPKVIKSPAAKAGCIYLKDNICIAKGTPCAHGDNHCLFYKTK